MKKPKVVVARKGGTCEVCGEFFKGLAMHRRFKHPQTLTGATIATQPFSDLTIEQLFEKRTQLTTEIEAIGRAIDGRLSDLGLQEARSRLTAMAG